MVIISLSPLKRERATTIAIAIVGRAIPLERKPIKKKQRTDTKKMQRGLRVITLQGAIEKSPILLSQYWKMNDRMVTYLFRILVVAIIFSPTVQLVVLKLFICILQILLGLGQLTVKGSSNRMLPRFDEPILS